MAQIIRKFLGYGLPWVRFRAWLRAEARVRASRWLNRREFRAALSPEPR